MVALPQSDSAHSVSPLNHTNGSEPHTLLREVRSRMDSAAALTGLSAFELALLQHPRRQLEFQIPVVLDSGARALFTGRRVQWNDARGPFKGGVRFHPGETEETIQGLAALMMLKTAVMNLPLGGAKGGVNCRTSDLSPQELERISRGYVRALAQDIGADFDVPAPDMYTNDQIMGWMADEFQQISRRYQPGVITGKPFCLGGSLGRQEATARGALIALREVAALQGISLQGPTMAVHGFGNIGSNILRLAEDMLGSRVVAVCDSKGGVYAADGLSVQGVLNHQKDTGSLRCCNYGDAISPEELLQLDIPILVLASMEGVINERNAADISASVILEVANGPTTTLGEQVLRSQGSFIVPDLICNAGGVTVSYFEQVQNAANYHWSEDKVNRRLDYSMTKAVHKNWETAQDLHSDLRTAAFVLAMETVTEAMRARGWC